MAPSTTARPGGIPSHHPFRKIIPGGDSYDIIKHGPNLKDTKSPNQSQSNGAINQGDFNSPLKRFSQHIPEASGDSLKKNNINPGFSGFASLLPCNEDPNEDKDDKIPHLSG